MFVFWSILSFLLAACSGQKSYEGWSLIKAYPVTDSQLEYLNTLRESDTDSEIRVWAQGSLKRPFDLFVAPDAKAPLLAKLDELNIIHVTSTENIQRAIEAEKKPVAPTSRSLSNVRNAAWFSKFLKLDEIYGAIQQLARNNPNLVSLETIGKTHMGKPITLVKLSSGGGGAKPGIWLDGGIHAREWASPATVLYILNKLVSGYNTNSTVKGLVDGATWYIVPVLNPDGYEYTHTTDRFWRKNRRPKSCSGYRCCEGVDLNRNFEYSFGGAGTSGNSCDETYRGPSAFSEPESQAVRNYVTSHKDIKAFLTIHAFSQMWFYPFGDREGSYPSDAYELESLAKRGAAALASLYGTRYDVGTAADLLYPAAGGSDDWAKGAAGIKYVYCLELRPAGTSAGNGFVLPPEQIVPTAEETWAGLSVVAKAVVGK